MSENNKIVMFSEEYENEQTGEKVDGITVLIDGKLKQTLDVIMQKENKYNSYTEVLRDLIYTGVENFIKKYK